MQRVLGLRSEWALVVYVAADVICVMLGMGVPIFCILLGVPVGWYVAERGIERGVPEGRVRTSAVRSGVATAAVTLFIMVLVWGRSVALFFAPGVDLAGVSIPPILYDVRASFVGWMALVIVVAPAVQVAMTLFGAHLTLMARQTRQMGDLVHRGV
jgi:hypothetical protein